MAFLAYLGYCSEGLGSYLLFIGILGTAIFLVLVPVCVSKALNGRLAFDFSPEGLIASDIGKERIPWNDIVGAKVQYFKRSEGVRLKIREDKARQLKTSWFAKINRPFYGDSEFFVSQVGTKLYAYQLVELINRRGVSTPTE
ncbi:hypothetical protein [Rhizobium lusitanum]|uniref:hypothetical protein n=2 Tax=Rhizobium TaxID=379 RepID=UPI00195D3A93|nr:hypothetical protein [Rhizobium lusitanum]MBM7047964.1 hypothetical protein [Rhizobium lusitanum]